MDLFESQRRIALERAQPLAERMRPRTLEEFIGQPHILGPGTALRRLIESDTLRSAILFGPPGSGKTTLARLVGERIQAQFVALHAAESGVREVRAVIEDAIAALASGKRTVLFLDEIHRFSRTQQDSLLAEVERGVLTLIGATTENPNLSLTAPLLSRSMVFEFKPPAPEDIELALRRALTDRQRGLAAAEAQVESAALRWIAERSGADFRRALSVLELAVASAPPDRRTVTADDAAQCMQHRVAPHDARGDSHYDLASALIKSMRGSDVDATLYWLARMLEGGEDPRFIARRIAIAASEDVGTADPTALLVAGAALQVTLAVGLPECRYALAQAAIQVALSPKSDAVTQALGAAISDVRDRPPLAVPAALRGTPRPGEAAPYRNPHEDPTGIIPQLYLPAVRNYYNPKQVGREVDRREQVRRLRDVIRERAADRTRTTSEEDHQEGTS